MKKNEWSSGVILQIDTLKHDIDVLRSAIYKEPLKSANYFYIAMLSQNQKFTKDEVRKHLYEIRNELFPTDNFCAFTEKYCGCLDYETSNISMFQGWHSLPLSEKTRKKNKKNPSLLLQIVFLASPSMLRQLAKNRAWFVDATFRSSARGFYQMLNIVTYNEELKRYIPSAHVLMSHKNEEAYFFLFSLLKTIASIQWFRLKTLKNHE